MVKVLLAQNETGASRQSWLPLRSLAVDKQIRGPNSYYIQ